MDFDMEIINEGQSPDPLFGSIITAMSSMKEATADKIYQKIQRQGATNYSKPQVDRALASALKYGIFEVKNHRYRIRDDVLDDIDTIYWKMQKKREQTPFRITDEMNEKHLGQKLDPEKDNLRFKKISDPEGEECPQCGRTKKPLHEKKADDKCAKREKKDKIKKKNKNSGKLPSKKLEKSQKHDKKVRKEQDENEIENDDEEDMREDDGFRKSHSKRKFRSSSPINEKRFKIKKLADLETNLLHKNDQIHLGDEGFMKPKKEYMPGGGKYDSTDESELESMSFLSDDEQSFGSYQNKTKNKQHKNKPICRFDSECDDVGFNGKGKKDIINRKKSNNSLKSGSATDLSSVTNNSKNDMTNNFDENVAYISPDKKLNNLNRFFGLNKLPEKEDENIGAGKSEWISDYVDDPNGDVIQRNNMLTIEPRNPMALDGPEHTNLKNFDGHNRSPASIQDSKLIPILTPVLEVKLEDESLT